MALPKNKHLRKITVDETPYYWKVEDNINTFQGLIVTVGFESAPYKRLEFEFIFDFDAIYPPSKEAIQILSEVTPNLIKESIHFAKENYNWGEQPTCRFKYESNVFVKI